MKKLILFYLIVSGMIFYAINSNSILLKEKFLGDEVAEASLHNITSTEHDFIEASYTSSQSEYLCVKLDDCYYCQLNQLKE